MHGHRVAPDHLHACTRDTPFVLHIISIRCQTQHLSPRLYKCCGRRSKSMLLRSCLSCQVLTSFRLGGRKYKPTVRE